MKKKLRKLNKKINHFFKKTVLVSVLISFVLNALGVVFSYLEGYEMLSMVLFLSSLIFTGLPIFYKALQSLCARIIGIELLVTIAVTGAIIIHEYSEAGIVCFLFQLGSFLELKTLEKTRSDVRKLVESAPKTALRMEDGEEVKTDVDDVGVGDFLALHTGNVIPVDGTLSSGEIYAMESSITGESMPVRKAEGDILYAGSIIDNGDGIMTATRVGCDSTYQKIISLVEEASDNKSKLERFIDRFAKYYTPCVILLSLGTLFIKYFITKAWDIDTSITVLVLACPGALVIGVPVASVAGIGVASRNKILLKGGDVIPTFSKSDCFVFDKTGTLTKGNTKVTGYFYFGSNETEDTLMMASMEAKSLHPLARAITEYLKTEVTDITPDTIRGKGMEYEKYTLGSLSFMEEKKIIFTEEERNILKECVNHGASLVLAAKENRIMAVFEISDEIKPESKAMIEKLLKERKRVILLTGDHEGVARSVAESLGIKEWYSGMLPEDKMKKIEALKKNHVVTFVGDGINDSPALASADIGISMGTATDVAIETSDLVLIGNSMTDLVKAQKIARKTSRISIENIIIAIGTVILLLVGLFLNYIHMSIGMLIHEASIFIVIFNAMRLFIGRRKEK